MYEDKRRKFVEYDQLTPSESKVWDLHQKGKTRKEISLELEMKPESVSRRLTVIREKLRAQLS